MTIFPDVPNFPGVPPLPRSTSAIFDVVTLLTADLLSGFDLFGRSGWGIYLDGFPVLEPDTMVSFDYRQSYSISDYPQEQGSFESYDKVNSPFDVRVRMARGGSIADRADFIDQLEALAPTTDLYDVVTPEKIYTSVNFTHFDYRRAATQGAGMIAADIWLQEIRVTGTQQFSQTKSPTAASPVTSGNVQTSPPTDNQRIAVQAQDVQ